MVLQPLLNRHFSCCDRDDILLAAATLLLGEYQEIAVAGRRSWQCQGWQDRGISLTSYHWCAHRQCSRSLRQRHCGRPQELIRALGIYYGREGWPLRSVVLVLEQVLHLPSLSLLHCCGPITRYYHFLWERFLCWGVGHAFEWDRGKLRFITFWLFFYRHFSVSLSFGWIAPASTREGLLFPWSLCGLLATCTRCHTMNTKRAHLNLWYAPSSHAWLTV